MLFIFDIFTYLVSTQTLHAEPIAATIVPVTPCNAAGRSHSPSWPWKPRFHSHHCPRPPSGFYTAARVFLYVFRRDIGLRAFCRFGPPICISLAPAPVAGASIGFRPISLRACPP